MIYLKDYSNLQACLEENNKESSLLQKIKEEAGDYWVEYFSKLIKETSKSDILVLSEDGCTRNQSIRLWSKAIMENIGLKSI